VLASQCQVLKTFHSKEKFTGPLSNKNEGRIGVLFMGQYMLQLIAYFQALS
jgi:hypothetical protein